MFSKWRFAFPALLHSAVAGVLVALVGFDVVPWWGAALLLGIAPWLALTWQCHQQRKGVDVGELARDLSRSVSYNALSSAGVAYSVKQLAQRLDSQLKAVASIFNSAESMIVTEAQAARLSQQAVGAAVESRQSSDEGRRVLVDTVGRMQQLRELATTSRERIEALNRHSDEIQRVTAVIESIASQTNLLALNAAIEAARAGEHGRGFAVVAGEVRSLAGRTTQATGEVRRMVDSIQQSTRDVVAQIHTLASELVTGVHEVEQAGQQLDSIAGLSASVESQISELASGTENNRQQLGRLFEAIGQVRTDLASSDQQTHRLGQEAGRLEHLTESISEQLAEIALDDYHQRVYDLAREGAKAVENAFEGAIRSGKLSSDDLFDRQYRPIAGTEPLKYHTRFDKIADQVLPPIQEPLLSRHEGLVFAIACTPDGYVPTHNQEFCQPLTGDAAYDMAHNRTKRLFNDRTGQRCGSHQNPLLMQTYARDTGELMHDLSVPIYVNGRHWGGFRLGYRPEEVSKAQ